MPVEESRQRWEQIFQNAGSRVEEDLRRVIQYINDEVVPEVRRNGSSALRFASAELQKIAQRMDDRAHRTPPPPPGDAPKP